MPGSNTKTKTAVTVTDIGRDFYGCHRDDTAYIRGQWHTYSAGVWMPVPDLEMRREIWMLLEAFESRVGSRPTLGLCNAVSDYLASRLFVRDEQVDVRLPAVANVVDEVHLGPHQVASFSS